MKGFEKDIQIIESITLKEMDSVALMSRTDTKYVFHEDQLHNTIACLNQHYRMLEIAGTRTPSYETLYFDTAEKDFYRRHHDGNMPRNKVRFRKYVNSDVTFFEIKNKTNKGKTIKKRIQAQDIQENLTEEQLSFFREVTSLSIDVGPHLYNSFNRLTLVHRERKERLTIDYNLKFHWKDQSLELKNVVIAEIKEERQSRDSHFMQALKVQHIRPMRISKYCIGSVMLFPELKHNAFKEKVLNIEKITQQ